MSEQLPPQPDKEPDQKINGQCWKCNHTVRSAMVNTRTVILTKQPWNSYTQLECLDKKCRAITIMFHDQLDDDTIATAIQYPTSIYEFLDESEDWEAVQDIRGQLVKAKIPEQQTLSTRSEDSVTHWGEFLQRVVVDVSDFGG